MNCAKHITERKCLLQGGSTWPGSWKTTHSRVVHGFAYSCLDSYLSFSIFHGWLDRPSLDSAGFAAVHTIGNTHTWDVSEYDALEVLMGRSDGKVYTISLEDERPLGWEGTFHASNRDLMTSRVMRFSDLIPRNWKQEQALKPLDLKNIKQLTIWIRSMGGIQEGGFSLNLRAINAVKLSCACTPMQDLILVAEREVQDQEALRVRAQELIRELKDILTKYMLKGRRDLLVAANLLNQQIDTWVTRINRRRLTRGKLPI